MPGIVQTYYPEDRTADVQIAVKNFLPTIDESGTDTDFAFEDFGIVPRMPIAWPRFGGFAIIGRLNLGDEVTCIFYDLPVGDFRATGQVSAPTRLERHGMDGIAMPCSIADTHPVIDAAPAAGEMVVGLDGDPAQIHISAGTIKLGSAATSFAAKADLVLTELGNIVSAYNGHTHAVSGAATGTPVVASLLPAPGNVAATVVKVA